MRLLALVTLLPWQIVLSQDPDYYCVEQFNGADAILTFSGSDKGETANLRDQNGFVQTVTDESSYLDTGGYSNTYYVRLNNFNGINVDVTCGQMYKSTDFTCNVQRDGSDSVFTFSGNIGGSSTANMRSQNLGWVASITNGASSYRHTGGWSGSGYYYVILNSVGHAVFCATSDPVPFPSTPPTASPIIEGDPYSCHANVTGDIAIVSFTGKRGTSENLRLNAVWKADGFENDDSITIALSGEGPYRFTIVVRGNGYSDNSDSTDFQCSFAVPSTPRPTFQLVNPTPAPTLSTSPPTPAPTIVLASTSPPTPMPMPMVTPTLLPTPELTLQPFTCTMQCTRKNEMITLRFGGLRGSSEFLRRDGMYESDVHLEYTTTLAGKGSSFLVRLRGNGYSDDTSYTDVQCVALDDTCTVILTPLPTIVPTPFPTLKPSFDPTTNRPTLSPVFASPTAAPIIAASFTCNMQCTEASESVVFTFAGLRGTSEFLRRGDEFAAIVLNRESITISVGKGASFLVRLRGNGYSDDAGFTDIQCVAQNVACNDTPLLPTPSPTNRPTSAGPNDCQISDILVPCEGALLGSSGDFTDKRGNPTSKVASFLVAEAKIGRQYDVFHDFLGRNDWSRIATQGFPYSSDLQDLVDGGRILFINWKNTGGPNEWADIAAGSQSEVIYSTGQQFANFKKKVFLTFHHEPEDNIRDTAGEGNIDAQYRLAKDYANAFKYIRAVFDDIGATNVIWVWDMQGFSKWFDLYENGLYPGDAYVDWVAFNKYNWYGCNNVDTWSNFEDTLASPMDWLNANTALISGTKPVMIGEFSTEENTPVAANSAETKGEWYGSIPIVLSNKYPRIKAMIAFDTEGRDAINAVPQFCYWGIDSSVEALDGFRAMAFDPFFNQWYGSPVPAPSMLSTAPSPTSQPISTLTSPPILSLTFNPSHEPTLASIPIPTPDPAPNPTPIPTRDPTPDPTPPEPANTPTSPPTVPPTPASPPSPTKAPTFPPGDFSCAVQAVTGGNPITGEVNVYMYGNVRGTHEVLYIGNRKNREVSGVLSYNTLFGVGKVITVWLTGNGYTLPGGQPTIVTCAILECANSEILAPCEGALLGSSGDFRDELGNEVNKIDTFLAAETQIGRRYDVFHDFLSNNDWNTIETNGFPYSSKLQGLVAGGRILFINWKNERGPNEWTAIATGSQDATIEATARAFAAFGQKVFLTFYHEPEDNIKKASPDDIEQQYALCRDYSDAFRYLHDKFVELGATNVVWVWDMQGFSDWFPYYENGLYPGNDVVDWVGFNKYNWYGCKVDKWTSFEETLASPMAWLNANAALVDQDKPVMIGEFSTEENMPVATNSDETKGDWFRSIPSVLANSYPRIKAMVMFDTEGRDAVNVEPQFCYWGIDSSPDALQGFSDMAANPYFNQWYNK